MKQENLINIENMDIIKEWTTLKEAIVKQPTLRPITVESWDRCKKLNIKPSNLKFTFLPEQVLKQKLQDNHYLIKAAKPYLDYLSLSLSGIPHVVALLDREGWILDMRGPAEEAGGKSKGLCIGASWREEHIGNNGGGTCLLEKKPVFIYGVEHFAKIYKSFSCLGVPIFKDNTVVGAIDVSVLNEYAHPGRMTIAMSCVDAIEKEINKVSKKKRYIAPAKKVIATAELMASAIHDLKNPLASIRGLAQLGILTSSSKNEHTYFQRIINQVDSLTRSVVDLQNVFKPEGLIKVNPSKIIKEIIDDMQATCKMNNINLILTSTYEGEIRIHIKVFRRAIENLIKNAIQVLPENGKITVDISHNKKELLISVNDNGPGIPDKIKKTLFEPFIYHRKDGTGLGLFMVHHAITEIHKGKIWFDSDPKIGTTFYISLPKES
ncbi:MAG: ATP-binding protein [Clostridia bacterium]